ncbi:hypothetical protein PISL3812_03950 [Talaromyces islandicus]|uniref:HAUS augmin-like complex subunit 6 N-terminal domain-containing protein n=1 Tax=Talaromyces islandicus TaxID=28573 RepID=A0A0U1LU62_TALIS|nr:hypothetical protein PISL3812_03950 [Talaromyces islandicus]
MQAPPRASAPQWSTPPPVTVFLRNIHLLQLDQQPDWPGLSSSLFSGGQKVQLQRVKGVEWALYHLFLLWDPVETKNKLRPFYPPLEPLQSVNLRAALFRALSDLKKNGDLGREAIVRKTMLDDCRGAKFEEILAVFSTAVLRKLVSQNSVEPGLKLAFAKGISHHEFDRLVPLVLAHHSTLETTRRNRSGIRESHGQFLKLLEAKSDELASRSKKKLRLPDEVPHPEQLEQEVKANWFGSQGWADALLNGGSNIETDAFLELPFEKAWSQAKGGNLNDLAKPSHPDLLQDLDARLASARRRLDRMKEFKTSMRRLEAESGIQEPTQVQKKDKGVVFKEHLTMTVANMSKFAQEQIDTPFFVDEHQAIISSMQEGLAKINAGGTKRTNPARNIRPRSPERPFGKQSSGNFQTLSIIPDSDKYSRSPSPNIQVTTPGNVLRPLTPDAYEQKQDKYRRPLPDSDDLPAGNSFDIAENSYSEQEPELPALPSDKFEHRQSSLLERTRQSMSLLPAQRSRQSLAARRQTRQSQVFPINQFETPPREQQPAPSQSGASTPRDEIFSDEADYASVFKSRPRVVQSPLMSPAIHVGLDSNQGMYDEDEGSGLDLVGDGSPLAMRMR